MSTRLNFQAENAIGERFQRRQTAVEQRTKAAVSLRVADRTFRMAEEQNLCAIERSRKQMGAAEKVLLGDRCEWRDRREFDLR